MIVKRLSITERQEVVDRTREVLVCSLQDSGQKTCKLYSDSASSVARIVY